MMRPLIYFVMKALKSIKRTPALTAATVGMLTVIFLLFNGFALISHNVSTQAERWISSVRMTAFLENSATPEDAQRIAAEFTKRPLVTGAFYVTQQEAEDRFLGNFPGSKNILEGLPKNPLPSSLELELNPENIDIASLEQLASDMEKLPEVEEALYGRELFSKLTAFVSILRLMGLMIGLALVVATLFLTANTIRLSLYARREEIGILQLVGATRWFIRWPYLIEGLLQGFLGAAFSILITWLLFRASLGPLADVLTGPFGQIELQFFDPLFISKEILAGAFLGTLGSFLALGRFWRTA